MDCPVYADASEQRTRGGVGETGAVAVLVGVRVGVLVGVLVGALVGVLVGTLVGVSVGVLVGVLVSVRLGVLDGDRVRVAVGPGVWDGDGVGIRVSTGTGIKLAVAKTGGVPPVMGMTSVLRSPSMDRSVAETQPCCPSKLTRIQSPSSLIP
jgi:hypothetical protein